MGRISLGLGFGFGELAVSGGCVDEVDGVSSTEASARRISIREISAFCSSSSGTASTGSAVACEFRLSHMVENWSAVMRSSSFE